MEFSLIFRNSFVMIGQIRRNPFRGNLESAAASS